ncbi:hypothetical protein OIDMADRAFT_43542 [Oidiodendron maius Zn]|uniref:Uncharacterized protein n=1 Tax=Oidiodendron maius (strain Zn) TaxID=913774 RepID=A0A0C3H606_OIDMZ|nr:hypothetical protein OIDMADRAFT_43542 [Oidiodendron maius Zn]
MPDIKYVEATLALAKDESKTLGLTLGTKNVTAGEKIPKAEAQSAPELSFAGTTGTYLVIGLDIDAPFPSFDILGPILHWIQPGLKPEIAADGTTRLSAAGTPFVANYIGPAPPPPSSPHRYVFLLYEQPEGFDGAKFAPRGGKKLSNMHRMRFDLAAWEKKANLGPVIASNYFVSN